jgi:hypothetical protein
MSTKAMIDDIRAVLSAARLGRYEAAAGVTAPDDPRAVELYAWHAQVSAALLAPLHICEVVVRNAVSEALEARYGARWPWASGFEQSLPPIAKHSRDYQPLLDVLNTRRNAQTTGKVIPELKFVFWQKMFTARHDTRLWTPHLRKVFPNLDQTQSIQDLRKRIYADLDQLRALRNRVAHHEPIFMRDLAADLQKMEELVAFRSTIAATWMMQNQQAAALIAARP